MGPKDDLPPVNLALVSSPLGASGKRLSYFPLLVSTLAFKGHIRDRDMHIFLWGADLGLQCLHFPLESLSRMGI